MNSYNAQLVKLRKDRNLTLKEAAKGIGITRFTLFLFENGYFRPRGKTLRKINGFYESHISPHGLEAYPTPIDTITQKEYNKKSLLIK